MRKFNNKRIGINSLLEKLAAEKKKAVIAAGLIIVMIFMWIKVLRSSGPQAAQAVPVVSGMENTNTESNAQMESGLSAGSSSSSSSTSYTPFNDLFRIHHCNRRTSVI